MKWLLFLVVNVSLLIRITRISRKEKIIFIVFSISTCFGLCFAQSLKFKLPVWQMYILSSKHQWFMLHGVINSSDTCQIASASIRFNFVSFILSSVVLWPCVIACGWAQSSLTTSSIRFSRRCVLKWTRHWFLLFFYFCVRFITKSTIWIWLFLIGVQAIAVCTLPLIVEIDLV